MNFLEKSFNDAKKMSDEDLLSFVQAHINECERKLSELSKIDGREERTSVEITALKYNLTCVLMTIKDIINDTEFCHNEAFSYRYQVPSFSLIEEAKKRIKRNRSYVFSKLKNCIT